VGAGIHTHKTPWFMSVYVLSYAQCVYAYTHVYVRMHMYTRVHVHIHECTQPGNLEQILTISEVPSKSEYHFFTNQKENKT